MKEIEMKTKPIKVVELAEGRAPASDEHDKMEQIRELMFGGVTRDFERRLKELGERFERESLTMREDYQKRISALESRLDPQLERLQAQLRHESAARTGAIEDVDTRFAQALRTQSNEINAILRQHEDEADAGGARLREAVAQLEEQIMQVFQEMKRSLHAASDRLDGEKLAREDLADLMAELALRLRGARDDAGKD